MVTLFNSEVVGSKHPSHCGELFGRAGTAQSGLNQSCHHNLRGLRLAVTLTIHKIDRKPNDNPFEKVLSGSEIRVIFASRFLIDSCCFPSKPELIWMWWLKTASADRVLTNWCHSNTKKPPTQTNQTHFSTSIFNQLCSAYFFLTAHYTTIHHW